VTRTKKPPQFDSYMDLIHRLPLRPFKSVEDYESGCRLYTELVATEPLDTGASDYADVLAGLIRVYDEKNSGVLRHIADKKPSPVELLRYLVDEHGMNTVELGKLVGGSGQASLILRGKRPLSMTNIRTLSEHFGVSPALFFDA
jgi:HTH-type transcriptional regulator/antitoxin HigA